MKGFGSGSAQVDRETEWLETDGLGGFASGTTSIRLERTVLADGV